MKIRLAYLILIIGLLALSACNQQKDPEVIYVTSTLAAPTAEVASLVTQPIQQAQPPTTAPDTPTPIPTAPPGVIFGPIVNGNETLAPTETRVPPTQPPITGPSATPAANVNFGPIVGPNYTLAPTETRMPPTQAPTVIPTSGPSPTPLPGLRRDLMGIQVHPHIDSREFGTVMARVKELGVGWVKYQFNWSLLEASPGQFTELFYIVREYVRQTHDQGFKVMISVAKAPGWSRTPDTDGTLYENGPSNDPQALADFITGMLGQIGRDAQDRPYVDAIQIWNEPNLQREWYGRPLTGGDYMNYFRPAYDAIRRFSSDIVVITAAPAPTGDSEWSTNDRTWIQQLYDAGLAQYTDNVGVGIHPYGWGNAPTARCCTTPSRGWDDKPQFFFLDTIEDYHNLMIANGHKNVLLWGTEFGWATFDGLQTYSGTRPADPSDTPYFSFIDQWQQASYTVEAFSLAQERPYIGPMILWNLNFSTIPGAVDQSDPKSGYSVVDSNWQPRPVFQYLQQVPKN